MNIKPILIVSILCLWSNALIAQVEKKVYQTLALSDSIMQIHFNFTDSCVISYWKQENKVMLETHIQMGVKSEYVIDNLAEDGRYHFVLEGRAAVNTLKFATKRPAIKKPKGDVIAEKVIVHVYLPESFELKSESAFRTNAEILMARKQ